jgi:hypothetical protein
VVGGWEMYPNRQYQRLDRIENDSKKLKNKTITDNTQKKTETLEGCQVADCGSSGLITPKRRATNLNRFSISQAATMIVPKNKRFMRLPKLLCIDAKVAITFIPTVKLKPMTEPAIPKNSSDSLSISHRMPFSNGSVKIPLAPKYQRTMKEDAKKARASKVGSQEIDKNGDSAS